MLHARTEGSGGQDLTAPSGEPPRTRTTTAAEDAGWSDLATDFYVSPRWFRHVENQTGADAVETWYLAAPRDGQVHAVLALYDVAKETNPNYDPAALTDSAVGGRFLLAGSRRGYTNALVAEAGSVGERAVDAVLSTAQQQSAGYGRAGLALLHLTTPAAGVITTLRPAARPLLTGLDTCLELPGEDFEDYLGSLARKRAWGVRQERTSYAGDATQVLRLSQCWEEAAPLVAAVQQKYGHDDTVDDCRAGLSRQAADLDDLSVVFALRRAGRLVATALFYHWRDEMYGRVVGFDYPALDGGEYFNLYFYQPIEYAYAHGVRRLHLGRGSYHAKFRRGAQACARWAIFLPSGPQDVLGPSDWRRRNAVALNEVRRDAPVENVDLPPGWCEA